MTGAGVQVSRRVKKINEVVAKPAKRDMGMPRDWFGTMFAKVLCMDLRLWGMVPVGSIVSQTDAGMDDLGNWCQYQFSYLDARYVIEGYGSDGWHCRSSSEG